jgi:hypothetical protein
LTRAFCADLLPATGCSAHRNQWYSPHRTLTCAFSSPAQAHKFRLSTHVVNGSPSLMSPSQGHDPVLIALLIFNRALFHSSFHTKACIDKILKTCRQQSPVRARNVQWGCAVDEAVGVCRGSDEPRTSFGRTLRQEVQPCFLLQANSFSHRILSLLLAQCSMLPVAVLQRWSIQHYRSLQYVFPGCASPAAQQQK